MFFLAADAAGDGFERGAQGADVCGESGEGVRFGCVVAVLVDERAQGGVAVEAGPADLGEGCDGGEGDGLAVVRLAGRMLVQRG